MQSKLATYFKSYFEKYKFKYILNISYEAFSSYNSFYNSHTKFSSEYDDFDSFINTFKHL